MKTIILASSSPRRISMMKEHGYDPLIIPSGADETLPFDMSPEASVMYTALKKAFDVCGKPEINRCDDPVIIAADTVVYLDHIIGKPESRDEAFRTLSAMRGREHHVMTGVCVIRPLTLLKTCFYCVSSVYFGDYSDEELRRYVDTDEPYDKAGGYAIQGTFGKYVVRVDGDVNNVIGFPWFMVEPYLL